MSVKVLEPGMTIPTEPPLNAPVTETVPLPEVRVMTGMEVRSPKESGAVMST